MRFDDSILFLLRAAFLNDNEIQFTRHARIVWARVIGIFNFFGKFRRDSAMMFG